MDNQNQIARLTEERDQFEADYLKTHNWLCDRNEELDAANKRIKQLEDALELVRSIIVDAANDGFNYSVGDWAERLFRSQSVTYDVLHKLPKKECCNHDCNQGRNCPNR